MARPIIPILLVPGDSTALWPLSDDNLPDALLALPSRPSLLRRLIVELRGTGAFADPFLVAPRACEAALDAEAEAERPGLRILLPEYRGSAAAAALAALAALDHDAEALLLIADAGRGMLDGAKLGAMLASAIARVEEGHAVSLAPGSGLLLVRADSLLARIAHHAPEVAQAMRKSLDAASLRDGRLRPEPKSHAQAAPCDLEALFAGPARDHLDLSTADIGWRPLAGWAGLFAADPSGAEGNHLAGEVAALDCRDCILVGDGGAIAALGLEGLLVVRAGDRLMIAPRSREGEISRLRAALEDAEPAVRQGTL